DRGETRHGRDGSVESGLQRPTGRRRLGVRPVRGAVVVGGQLTRAPSLAGRPAPQPRLHHLPGRQAPAARPPARRPPDRLRAHCVPRAGYTTGDLDVHAVAVEASGRVVFVNTRFGCLATLSERASFTPLWRPPWLSRLAPEDRCHLNGLWRWRTST